MIKAQGKGTVPVAFLIMIGNVPFAIRAKYPS